MIKGSYCKTSKEDEQKKYLEIRKVAEDRVMSTEREVKKLADELHELGEVYDLDEKEGLAQWFIKDNRFSDVRKELQRAKRIGKKPYFGRIDIEDADAGKRNTYYIGKSVLYVDPADPMVIDWRSPVASVYYDKDLGKCSYRVPHEGRYDILLDRKRTYEIDEEGLHDFYDSEVVANDELLTKYLSKSKKNVLSEIIATIQQEQNEVIRINPHHNVLIQGSAGSGKTTVAMHRISYILYNYEKEFAAEDFYIVGSNKVLLNYITGVLPDLDVYDIKQYTMEELFVRLLYEEWTDKNRVRTVDKTDRRIGIKGSSEWFDALEEYCGEYLIRNMSISDIRLKENNHILMTSEDIKKILREMKGKTIKSIYERLTDVLISKLENEMFGKGLTYSQQMQKRMYAFYESFFYRRAVKESVWDIYDEFIKTRFNKNGDFDYIKGEPDLYDLACLAYIYKRLKETEVIREACHVVIDEAQDFGISVYRSLKYCLSKCTFTIMGDVAQNINIGCGLGDWEELKKVMLPGEYDYFGLLKKSYRNTIEVSRFATDILRHASFPIYPTEPIIRHGEEVDIIQCVNRDDNIEKIANKLDRWNEQYETVAIICRDVREAEAIAESLNDDKFKDRHNYSYVNLFSLKESDMSQHILVLPIEYSKGLEFDAVIISDASKEAYPYEDGYAKLLYVAATRALHELAVCYTGELTGLIADEIPKGRENIYFEDDDFHKKALVMEEDTRTVSEMAAEQALIGDSDRAHRDNYGPKKIEAIKPVTAVKVKKSRRVLINEHGSSLVYGERNTDKGSSYLRSSVYGLGGVSSSFGSKAEKSGKIADKKPSEFGEFPDSLSLKPPGHGSINHSVKWVDADKEKVTATSFYDNIMITPVSDDAFRITIYKSEPVLSDIPKELENQSMSGFKCTQSKNSIDVITKHAFVSIDKKSGTVSFGSNKRGVLLKENTNLSRQYNEANRTWWHFLAWGKKDILKARGEGENWITIDATARYVSCGPDSDNPAVIMSMEGYRLVIPAKTKALLSTIQSYSSFIRYENKESIEFYFQVVIS